MLVNGDLLDEANETYFVNLTNPTNATIADGQGLGTITDDDPLPALLRQRRDRHRGRHGQRERGLHGHLDAASGRTVSVDYATADGTAQAPGDYQARTGTLTFAPGRRRRWSRSKSTAT